MLDYLDKCAKAYYEGKPIISDQVFDRLAEVYKYTKVGARAGLSVKKHFYRMYSLQKFYEGEGKANPLANYSSDISYSWKLDGAAISLLYVDGKLQQVLVRGDGVEGTEVTNKFIQSSIVPTTINRPGVIQVTGEIVAPLHIENARNYAAGSLNLSSVEEFKTRALSFFAYAVYPYISHTYDEDMKQLEKLGFSTIKDPELDKVYPVDGVVYRLNSNTEFDKAGFTADHPRGAYAKKIRTAGVETTLREVEWNTSRSGKVTPVAIFDPIVIGDAKISRATLNNPGFIEALDLHIGDRILVVRSGEIIPTVVSKADQ